MPSNAASACATSCRVVVALSLLAAVTFGCGTEQNNPVGAPGVAGGGGSAPVAGSSSVGAAGPGDDPYAIPATAPASVVVPSPRLARLSRQQWSNAIRDLLKLTDVADVENGVSGDALINFDNEAEALFVTEQLRQQLATAAEKLADKSIADPAVLASLAPPDPAGDSASRARAFVTKFGRRAFRRPLSESEVTSHLELFNRGATLYPGADAFASGVSLVLQAMLQSPHFLYRTELASATPGASKVPLSDHEVAAKLAFSLTNTIPDDALSAAADAGQLRDIASVKMHAARLLDGERGTSGFNNFNMQVYRLGTYDGIIRDTAIFPEFTPQAPASMRREVLEFIDWMFIEGRGVKDFYTTPVGFVNAALAPLYEVSGNFPADVLTRVDLDPTRRSGILTQPGFLSSYAKGADPDIIHRGVFIATRLLCKELPPPAPNAGALLDLQPNMTNRERVEMTTGKGTCGEVCHANLFNPLGYAFENYDAIGKYRTSDHGKPVDAADVYSLDGQLKTFSNGVELSHALAEAKELHACYVRNMMTYLHGRAVTPDESANVDYYARLSRAGVASLRELQLAIVTSDAFLNRLP